MKLIILLQKVIAVIKDKYQTYCPVSLPYKQSQQMLFLVLTPLLQKQHRGSNIIYIYTHTHFSKLLFVIHNHNKEITSIRVFVIFPIGKSVTF